MRHNVDRLESKFREDGVHWFSFARDPRHTRYATVLESDGMQILASRRARGETTDIVTARGRAVVRGASRDGNNHRRSRVQI